MFKCNECGAEFYEPDTYRDWIGDFWGIPAYEEFAICPVCKSEDFEEVDDNEDF